MESESVSNEDLLRIAQESLDGGYDTEGARHWVLHELARRGLTTALNETYSIPVDQEPKPEAYWQTDYRNIELGNN
jgi:hypothetical protein